MKKGKLKKLLRDAYIEGGRYYIKGHIPHDIGKPKSFDEWYNDNVVNNLAIHDVVVPKGTLPLSKFIKEVEGYEHGQQTHIIPRTPERMRTILAATHWCKKIAERLTNK